MDVARRFKALPYQVLAMHWYCCRAITLNVCSTQQCRNGCPRMMLCPGRLFSLVPGSPLWTHTSWLHPTASGEALCETSCAFLIKLYKMLLVRVACYISRVFCLCFWYQGVSFGEREGSWLYLCFL